MEIELKVNNDLGLHARVAARIVETLMGYDSEVLLVRDQVEAAADSVLEILTLGAAKGSVVVARAEGLQAKEALVALQNLFAANFGEV